MPPSGRSTATGYVLMGWAACSCSCMSHLSPENELHENRRQRWQSGKKGGQSAGGSAGCQHRRPPPFGHPTVETVKGTNGHASSAGP